MSTLLAAAADLVAIAVLTFAVHSPRHRRRNLVAAFLGVNIGVFAVATVLGSTTVGAGLASASSACCRSSGCARTRSPSTRSRTTSQRSHSA